MGLLIEESKKFNSITLSYISFGSPKGQKHQCSLHHTAFILRTPLPFILEYMQLTAAFHLRGIKNRVDFPGSIYMIFTIN